MPRNLLATLEADTLTLDEENHLCLSAAVGWSGSKGAVVITWEEARFRGVLDTVRLFFDTSGLKLSEKTNKVSEISSGQFQIVVHTCWTCCCFGMESSLLVDARKYNLVACRPLSF